MSEPTERDRELACEATANVTDCPEWLTDDIETACALARAEGAREEREAIVAQLRKWIDETMLLDWIEARGKEGGGDVAS